MYLLLIFFLIIVVPLIVMPKNILTGNGTPYGIVLRAALCVSTAALAVFVAASLTGQGVFAQVQDAVEDLAKTLAADQNVADMFGLADASGQERTRFFTELYSGIFELLPVDIMIWGAVVAYAEYALLSRILKRRMPAVKRLPPLREFSFPRNSVTGVVLMYLLSWILTITGILSNDLLYVNMNFLFDFVFSLQGVSAVLMFFHMKRVPKAIGIIIALLIWMIVIGRMMLVLLGMLDLLLNMKARIQGGSSGRS